MSLEGQSWVARPADCLRWGDTLYPTREAAVTQAPKKLCLIAGGMFFVAPLELVVDGRKFTGEEEAVFVPGEGFADDEPPPWEADGWDPAGEAV